MATFVPGAMVSGSWGRARSPRRATLATCASFGCSASAASSVRLWKWRARAPMWRRVGAGLPAKLYRHFTTLLAEGRSLEGVNRWPDTMDC